MSENGNRHGDLASHSESTVGLPGMDGVLPARTETTAERKERVGKATYAITAFNMAGRVMGFLEGLLVARYFGAGATSGAYFAATKAPWAIFSFGEQLLTHAFLPPFVEAREKRGEESAWKLASLVATAQLLILAAVVLLSMLFTPWLVGRYTHHFTSQETHLTITLTRIMLPAVVFMSLSSLTYVLLNAYKQFALPAFGDTALKAGVVLMGFGFWRFLGIKAFAAGLLLGAFIKLATHLFGLKPRLHLLRWNLDFKDQAAKRLLALMIPLMAGNVLSSARPFLDTWFSGPTREVAALNFAFKLTNLPFMIVPYALGIALFPFLAEMATRGDKRQLGRALVSALRMVSFLMVPIMIAYLILAQPLIETVFMRGQFTSADASRVAVPLVWYSFGMLPVAFETIVLQIFFALSDTKTPTIVAYGTFVLYVLVALVSTQVLGWGAAGVALAVTVSKLVKDLILMFILTPRLEGLELKGTGVFAGKLAAASAVMALMLWATLRFGYHSPTPRMAPAGRAPGAAAPVNTVPVENGPGLASSSTGTNAPGLSTKPAKKPKAPKSNKMKAVKVFVICAAPGSLAFLVMAYWLGIPELFTLYGVAERRLRPLLFRIAGAAMAPW